MYTIIIIIIIIIIITIARKCSLRYSYVALVSDQEFCSFEEEPEMALVIGQEFCSFEELSEC